MALEEINKKVLSYCEIPEELTEKSFLQEVGCDCYINYSINTTTDYPINPLDRWIIKTYPELENTSFLIEMDY